MDRTVWGGLAAGLVIATVTAPVGVSGAVFPLPAHDGALRGDLARRLVLGTLPGVVLGATVGAFALPGPDLFRLLAAALLLPLGLWLCLRALAPARPGASRPRAR